MATTSVLGGTIGTLSVWNNYMSRIAFLANTGNANAQTIIENISNANKLITENPTPTLQMLINTMIRNQSANYSIHLLDNLRSLIGQIAGGQLIYHGPAQEEVSQRWSNLTSQIWTKLSQTKDLLNAQDISRLQPPINQYIRGFLGFGICFFLLALLLQRKIIPAVNRYRNRDLIKIVEDKEQRLREINLIWAEIKGQVVPELPAPKPGENYTPDDSTPDKYICPITKQIIRVPIFIAADNHHYERSALTRWWLHLQHNQTTPLTRASMTTNPIEMKVDDAFMHEIQHYMFQRSKPWSNCSIL